MKDNERGQNLCGKRKNTKISGLGGQRPAAAEGRASDLNANRQWRSRRWRQREGTTMQPSSQDRHLFSNRRLPPAGGDHTWTYGGAWWRHHGTDGHFLPIFSIIYHRQADRQLSAPEKAVMKHETTETPNGTWTDGYTKGWRNLLKTGDNQVFQNVSPKQQFNIQMTEYFTSFVPFS